MAGSRLCALMVVSMLGLCSTPAASADPLAEAFGTQAALWGVSLSPDGTKVSFLQMHASDTPIAVVVDLVTGKPTLVLASDKGKFDIYKCGWANNERLLCGLYGFAKDRGRFYPVTRVVAVNADATDMRVLLQEKLKYNRFAQFQDDVVDWLVDDPEHVLIELPTDAGTGVVRLDIYKGSTKPMARARDDVREWMSDGRGALRLRMSLSERRLRWWYTLAGEGKWRRLHDRAVTDLENIYEPVGFLDDPNSLLVFKPSDGRVALWSEELANDRKATLVFQHTEVDVANTFEIGKFGRIVAAVYYTDRPHLHFFDPDLEVLTAKLSGTFPDEMVQVVDESWDRRFYVIHVGSDQSPGTYYYYDLEASKLTAISAQYPMLEGHRLAAMKPIRYPARDGVSIPGYLTAPSEVPEGGLPTVILPHGGPQARDYWGYDWLAHYFAARGYAVLQSNYRGSGGYGQDWSGEGGFRQWRTAINDIDDGLQYLIDSGVADPGRVCVVGWSYGGYAALMSAAVYPDRYRCAVSIAGVTDLDMLVTDMRRFVGGRGMKEFIGSGAKAREEGSPVERAGDIQVPVLLFHGDLDINVGVKHSRAMKKALKKKKKVVTYVEYEDVDHSISRNAYRIDMLTKIGALLDESTPPRDSTPSRLSGR
jgi:dipeptidyl aminopeptidase/acylaminoacyl peptidase